MPLSRLQEPFMKDIAASFKATQARIIRRLSKGSPNESATIVEEELRGSFTVYSSHSMAEPLWQTKD